MPTCAASVQLKLLGLGRRRLVGQIMGQRRVEPKQSRGLLVTHSRDFDGLLCCCTMNEYERCFLSDSEGVGSVDMCPDSQHSYWGRANQLVNEIYAQVDVGYSKTRALDLAMYENSSPPPDEISNALCRLLVSIIQTRDHTRRMFR